MKNACYDHFTPTHHHSFDLSFHVSGLLLHPLARINFRHDLIFVVSYNQMLVFSFQSNNILNCFVTETFLRAFDPPGFVYQHSEIILARNASIKCC